MVVGPLAGDDVPALCERLRAILSTGIDVVVCDVAAAAADLVTIEALARLQLTALNAGGSIVLREASADLGALLAACGLHHAVPGER